MCQNVSTKFSLREKWKNYKIQTFENVKTFETQKHTLKSSQGIGYTAKDCFCFVCVAVVSLMFLFLILGFRSDNKQLSRSIRKKIDLRRTEWTFVRSIPVRRRSIFSRIDLLNSHLVDNIARGLSIDQACEVNAMTDGKFLGTEQTKQLVLYLLTEHKTNKNDK